MRKHLALFAASWVHCGHIALDNQTSAGLSDKEMINPRKPHKGRNCQLRLMPTWKRRGMKNRDQKIGDQDQQAIRTTKNLPMIEDPAYDGRYCKLKDFADIAHCRILGRTQAAEVVNYIAWTSCRACR